MDIFNDNICLKVNLPYDTYCPSVGQSVGWTVGLSSKRSPYDKLFNNLHNDC